MVETHRAERHRRRGGLAEREVVEARLAAREAVSTGESLAGLATPEPRPARAEPGAAGGNGDRASSRAPTDQGERPGPTGSQKHDDVIPFSPIRRRTAEHLVRSLATAAHTLVVIEVDYHLVETARRRAGLTALPFVAWVAVEELRRYPHLNASVVDDGLRVHRHVNLGIAVDLDFQGLIVPVVRRADEYRLTALAERITAIATRAHDHALAPADVEGGTFTITNAGGYGTFVTGPVINQPQVAILSTDGIRMRPAALPDGRGGWQVAVRPIGNLSLSFDHRAVDGAYAAAFLAAVRDKLQDHDWEAEVR